MSGAVHTPLVERLREGVWGKSPLSGSMPGGQAMSEAADTITELLEALENIMLAAMSSDATKQQIAQQAHAAIARAKGDTQ